MENSLQQGDKVFVFKPLIGRHFFIHHDQIILFKLNDSKIPFVKRVVACSGDYIAFEGRNIYVNGNLVENNITTKFLYRLIPQSRYFNKYSKMYPQINLPKYQRKEGLLISLSIEESNKLQYSEEIEILERVKSFETLINKNIFINRKYTNKRIVFEIPSKGDTINVNPSNYLVYKNLMKPEVFSKFKKYSQIKMNYILNGDCYFVVGDNRHFSYDSRHFGFISEDNLIGRVVYKLKNKRN